MITVQEAIQIISTTIKDFGTEQLPLINAIGRVLREDLVADRNFPPYNRVTMDGIGIRSADYDRGQRAFPIQGVAAAGSPQMHLEESGGCMEVMTGAILPEGTDVVIRYEDLTIENGMATINIDTVRKGQNVHKEGEDRAAGDLVVKAGKRLSPAEIGVAATIGKHKVLVSRLPKVAIISTGDELVEIDEQPLPHQIRKSNVYRISATLSHSGISITRFHLNDDMEEILEQLKEILDSFEVVLLSGGVSKGKFDFLPAALDQLGVKKLFHKIKQRPGKPFWFGQAPSGTTVFALPGNPVSSFLCTHRYVIPWLNASLQSAAVRRPYGILAEDFTFKPDLTYFLQVRIEYSEEGQILAFPVEGHGSGDLANLVDATAFLELPRGRDNFDKGEVFPLYFYR